MAKCEEMVGISTTVTNRVKKVGDIELQERSMTDIMSNRPNVTVDLSKLENVKIPRVILQRGMNLKGQKRVKRNKLYPWKFQVTGDAHATGTSVYFVDIAKHECSCMWFQNTGSTCKHLVAALLVFMEDQEREALDLARNRGGG